MNCVWQMDLRPNRAGAPAFLPPPAVEEMAWDILLALYSDRDCELSLEKLGSFVSAPPRAMQRWLASLEERCLITGTQDEATGELRAVLSLTGRTALDRYFSGARDLQLGARH